MARKITGSRSEYTRMHYKILREKGLCARCLKPAVPSKANCEVCAMKARIADKMYKAKAREAKAKEIHIEDDDKGEYKMTDEEREDFKRRWDRVFIPVQQTVYIYKAKDTYDGYSNK